MIVRRRSLRAAEYDTVDARLRSATPSIGLLLLRLLSRETRGRVLIVLHRDSRSDSEPDVEDEMGAAGASTGGGAGSASAELLEMVRLLAPLSCCCWRPVSAEDTEVVLGRENVTPFVLVELPDSLRSIWNGARSVSGEADTVCAVTAVVGLDGLMTGTKGEGSARTVTIELVEILRLFVLSVVLVLLRVSRDSDGKVGRDGGTANAGRRRSGSDTFACRDTGVGEGS